MTKVHTHIHDSLLHHCYKRTYKDELTQAERARAERARASKREREGWGSARERASEREKTTTPSGFGNTTDGARGETGERTARGGREADRPIAH